MTQLKLYNTETREKEPVTGHALKMYTCGPTVYNFAHIGNFRTYVFEDLLRRTLKFFGAEVIQAMNITDVEDKILEASLKAKLSLHDFTAPYIRAFFEDLRALHIQPVEFYPRATEFIPEMVQIIEKLLDLKIAYRVPDGSVFYSISHFPAYGRLSHLCLENLKIGASERNTQDEYEKENPCDFVLWKSYNPERDGGVFWETSLGKGRPGWHIECSAMAMKVLGETVDIHAGGVDNMFPHHENEIAQSEAYSGKLFVRHWVHSEHLLVEHKKMSKSLGNFYTLRDLLKKGYTGTEVRYMLIHTHYRTQLNFTFEGLEGARHSLERLGDFIARLQAAPDAKKDGKIAPVLKQAETDFSEALADDLNISVALAALFELVRKVNTLCDEEKIGKGEAEEVLSLLHRFDQVLGFLPFEREEEVPAEFMELLLQREEARKSKNWKEADAYRDKILAAGFMIEDTPGGARLKKKGGRMNDEG
ncbi:MAG: cysteine--tRNA ligase [Chlamydiales bacterium]